MRRPAGKLPNFLIVGASRSGTTSLHHYLSKHADVFLPDRKELRFFDRDRNYQRGLDHYRSHFGSWSGQKIIGEASPPYFFHGITSDSDDRHRFDLEDDAPGRIARALPEARILITLRNPIDRSYSQYWKNRADRREPAATYRLALEEELAGKRTPRETPACWVYKNSYSVHLKRWLNLFPESMCKVLIFEEWTLDPASMLRELAAFLEVDPDGMPKEFAALNVGNFARRGTLTGRVRERLKRSKLGRYLARTPNAPSYPKMDLETRRFALESFQRDIEHLERMSGRSLDLWRDV